MSGALDTLQERIGYRFRDPALLERALTHASWMQDNPDAPGNNQRLEFLGDSVLQLILTEALFALFPSDREGELTKRRAILGKGEFLSRLARETGIDACLRLGANEEATGGRGRDAALEDAFEAVVGAISPLPTAIAWWSPVLAFGVSVLVGVIFGVVPARRAGRLDPVVALRTD